MARNRVTNPRTLRRLSRETELTVVGAMTRGGTDHRFDITAANGARYSYYRKGPRASLYRITGDDESVMVFAKDYKPNPETATLRAWGRCIDGQLTNPQFALEPWSEFFGVEIPEEMRAAMIAQMQRYIDENPKDAEGKKVGSVALVSRELLAAT